MERTVSEVNFLNFLNFPMEFFAKMMSVSWRCDDAHEWVCKLNFGADRSAKKTFSSTWRLPGQYKQCSLNMVTFTMVHRQNSFRFNNSELGHRRMIHDLNNIKIMNHSSFHDILYRERIGNACTRHFHMLPRASVHIFNRLRPFDTASTDHVLQMTDERRR